MKSRETLLIELRKHSPAGAHEAAMLERIIRFVEGHENCFERSLAAGHVTGSAWVVDQDRSHVLLTHHRKLDKWLQPGGHADGDPDVLRVALREVEEESGLSVVSPVSEAIFDVDAHCIPARGAEPEHVHYDVRFLIEADRSRPLRISHESKDLAWVPLVRVGELNTDDSVMRMVSKTASFGPAKIRP
jgi:8-oxo-dGTP pyrophosphatase MutT (NUDIX family)